MYIQGVRGCGVPPPSSDPRPVLSPKWLCVFMKSKHTMSSLPGMTQHSACLTLLFARLTPMTEEGTSGTSCPVSCVEALGYGCTPLLLLIMNLLARCVNCENYNSFELWPIFKIGSVSCLFDGFL